MCRMSPRGLEAEMCSARANVRFGSKADMCSAPSDVRLVPIADISPSHSITSSARNKIAVGRSTPIALAVFKFTTISNFVGCSIGKSEGTAPRAIRSTNSATRAKSAVMLGP